MTVPAWLVAGYYIDAKDSVNDWCVAKVLEINTSTNTVEISFDGWSGRRNSTYQLPSNKLAPFRSRSYGYTGPKRSVLRGGDYSRAQTELLISELRSVISAGLICPSAFETTQFYRGRLFIYTEVLASTNNFSPREEELALEFFALTLELIVRWLEAAPRLFPLYYKFSSSNRYLEDNEVALACVWSELLLTLGTLFGQERRANSFFACDFIPDDYEPSTLTVYPCPRTPTALAYFVNRFAKEGGFAALARIVQEEEVDARVPFVFVSSLPLNTIGELLAPEFAERFCREFADAVFRRVDLISEEECKVLRYEEVVAVLDKLASCFADEAELELSKAGLFLKMLRCPFLEKRIKGLVEINSLIEGLECVELQTELRTEALQRWLLENRIVEAVLTDRPHLELLKRAGTLLRFLARYGTLEDTHLELLWGCAQGKHESFVRAAYGTLLEITPLLSPEALRFLARKFHTIPYSEFDAHLLQVVKEFTSKALDADERRWASPERFGAGILRALMYNEERRDLSNIATKFFGEVLVKHPLAVQEEVQELIKNLRCNVHVPQSLKLLTILVLTGREGVRELREINETHGLKDLVLQNTVAYMRTVQADPRAVGSYGLGVNLKRRLDFVAFMVNKAGVHLSSEDFALLWELFVSGGVMSDLFFRWLMTEHNTNYLIQFQEASTLFRNYFLDPERFPPAQVSTQAFSCFSWLFMNLNNMRGYIKADGESVKLRRAREVEGQSTLVLIQLHAEPVVAVEACKLLIGLLTRFNHSFYPSAPEILTEFTDFLLPYLRTQSEGPVSRGLGLLKALLKHEGETLRTHLVVVKDVASREVRHVYVDLRKNVRHLRVEVARAFAQSLDRTVLDIGEQRYGAALDELELSGIKLHWVHVEFDQTQVHEFDVTETLSQNSDLFSYLFTLLAGPSASYTDLAWELLRQLPVNRALQKDIKSLKKPLEEILEHKSLYRLLYELSIVHSLAEDSRWQERFATRNGPEHLLGVYMNANQPHPSALHARFEEKLLVVLGTLLRRALPAQTQRDFFARMLESLYVVSCHVENRNYSEFFEQLKQLLARLSPVELAVAPQLPACKRAVVATLVNCSSPVFSKLSYQWLVSASAVAEADFFDLLATALPEALVAPTSSKYFWRLIAVLVPSAKLSALYRLVEDLVAVLERHPGERSSGEKNAVLGGAMRALASAWTPSGLEVQDSHLELLLSRCLFEIPESGAALPKCKHPHTRKQAFRLILQLCCADTGFLAGTVRFLGKFHRETQWRTAKRADWNNLPTAKERSDTGFVGLKNLGCTCYMNSLFQQLHLIPSFREGVLAAPANAPLEENLLYQLQFIFSGLKHSDKQYITPKAFTRCFKDAEGQPVNVMEQMDVDEFFSACMDKIEGLLRGTSQEKLVQQHFGGLQVTEVIGKDCTHRSKCHEPFLSIPLEVKNKQSILQGLESFVEGENLEGENAYQCDSCNAKVDAVRRVSVTHLPNHLIISLRRFEFDFDTMTRQKLNDYCDFPQTLNMLPFTQEGLDAKSNQGEGDTSSEIPQRAADYYQYTLKGVIIHIGTAESGHYYSFVYDTAQDEWFEFNDTWVKKISEEDIANEAYGGEEKVNWPGATCGIREKYGNAYMLFYVRKQAYDFRTTNAEDLQAISLEVHEAQNRDLDGWVKQENQRFWRSKHIFGTEYLKFVSQMITLPQPPAHFLIEFMITILIRTKDKPSGLYEIYKYIESALQNSDLSEWYLEIISQTQLTQELLIYCPMILMRKLIVSLAKTAILNIDLQVALKIMLRLLQIYHLATKKQSKHFSQYWELVKTLALKFPAVGRHLDLANRLVHIVLKQSVDFSLPPTARFSNIYLGYDLQINKMEVSRDESYFLDNRGYSMMHVYEYISKNVQFLSNESQEKLVSREALEIVLKDLESKATAWWVGKIFSHLCVENLDRSHIYLECIIDKYKSAEFSFRTKYLKLAGSLFIEHDHLFRDKVFMFMKNFFKAILNCKYAADIEFNLSFLFKICTKQAKVRELVVSNFQEELGKVELQIQSHLKTNYNNFKNPAFEESDKPTLRAMLMKLNRLMSDEPPNSHEFDSDADIENRKVTKVNEIDVKDPTGQNWKRCKVLTQIGDLVLVATSAHADLKDFFSDEVLPAGSKT